MSKKKNFFLIFKVVVTIAILFALFKLVPYQKIIEVFKDSNKIYLFYAALIFFSCYFIAACRWRFLLSSLGVDMSFKEVFYAFFSGLFFNLFFPSFVAGDVFRSMSISYRHGSAKKVASSVLMDRFSGAIALVSVSAIAYFFGRDILNDPQIIVAIAILCLIIVFSSLVIFNRKVFLFLTKIFRKNDAIEEKIISFHDQLYFFKNNPKVLLKSLYFSVPMQMLTAISFFIASRAFGVEVSIVNFLILVPIIMAIAMIPITIAGAGTREASAVYFFSLIGIEKSIGLGISLLNLILMIVVGILGGIFYVSVYHRWLQSHSPSKKS
ncbi:MAG: flippase-like domain-containing protein [Candidatus Omnitrophica bacterium]|nr:flippase-like domain-containing protein [Candidatus Omnitrophota bacterium]